VWNYHDVEGAAEPATTTVTITGFPAGMHKALLEHYRIDDAHSNAYTAWLAMGSPQHPTVRQYADLKAAGQLQLLTSPQWVDITNGRMSIKTSIPRQGISLMRLAW
jgi:xylan 1,4-beta-xylosidase